MSLLRFTHSSIAIILIVSAQSAQLAHAQTGTLEEVIVTAEKRASNLQDTPIAISAFSGDDLNRALINKPLDLQFSVPNMLMSKSFFSGSNISIRGVGNLATGVAADSGTGSHFNGVYLNNSRIFEMEFFDTQRVEVLRGPQGTLYGRNTTAGVINFIPKAPEDEFGGDLTLELGNYDHVRAKGAINIPLNENWSQRFAGFYLSRDGFVDNEFNGDDIDGRDQYSVRSSTRWANDKTDATLVANYYKEDSNRMRGSNQMCKQDPDGIIGCLPTSLANERTNSAATVSGFLVTAAGAAQGLVFPENDFENALISSDPRKQYLDYTPSYQVEDTIVSFEINHELGDLTLTSLTGYHDSDLDARTDSDFAVASEAWPVEVIVHTPDGAITVDRSFAVDQSTTNSEQWSQELRLASSFDTPWNFMVGGFYLNYESEVRYRVYSAALEYSGEVFDIDPS